MSRTSILASSAAWSLAVVVAYSPHTTAQQPCGGNDIESGPNAAFDRSVFMVTTTARRSPQDVATEKPVGTAVLIYKTGNIGYFLTAAHVVEQAHPNGMSLPGLSTAQLRLRSCEATPLMTGREADVSEVRELWHRASPTCPTSQDHPDFATRHDRLANSPSRRPIPEDAIDCVDLSLLTGTLSPTLARESVPFALPLRLATTGGNWDHLKLAAWPADETSWDRPHYVPLTLYTELDQSVRPAFPLGFVGYGYSPRRGMSGGAIFNPKSRRLYGIVSKASAGAAQLAEDLPPILRTYIQEYNHTLLAVGPDAYLNVIDRIPASEWVDGLVSALRGGNVEAVLGALQRHPSRKFPAIELVQLIRALGALSSEERIALTDIRLYTDMIIFLNAEGVDADPLIFDLLQLYKQTLADNKLRPPGVVMFELAETARKLVKDLPSSLAPEQQAKQLRTAAALVTADLAKLNKRTSIPSKFAEDAEPSSTESYVAGLYLDAAKWVRAAAELDPLGLRDQDVEEELLATSLAYDPTNGRSYDYIADWQIDRGEYAAALPAYKAAAASATFNKNSKVADRLATSCGLAAGLAGAKAYECTATDPVYAAARDVTKTLRRGLP